MVGCVGSSRASSYGIGPGEALTSLIAAGIIAAQPVAPLTHLLSGAMNEAALWLASSTNPDDLADTWAALSRFLEAMRD
ncbi:hypothetical protein [Kibdelosporangium banguiense]|uniref:hypothetical protein n=1 Tax=Kibdelosporangium banguiense TaxID=1365924 RepID=UPI0035586A9E